MAFIGKCPGADRLRDAIITEKICPECGREIELFSIFPTAQCVCGFTVYNETQSCIKWCKYARECVGADVYDNFIQNSIATDAPESKEKSP